MHALAGAIESEAAAKRGDMGQEVMGDEDRLRRPEVGKRRHHRHDPVQVGRAELRRSTGCGDLLCADEDEALAIANGTAYGLEGYVVGADTERALAFARRVRAGEVKVNGSSIMSLHLMTPRPAWGMSGLGEEGTIETIRCFTGARVVGVEGSFALHGR